MFDEDDAWWGWWLMRMMVDEDDVWCVMRMMLKCYTVAAAVAVVNSALYVYRDIIDVFWNNYLIMVAYNKALVLLKAKKTYIQGVY